MQPPIRPCTTDPASRCSGYANAYGVLLSYYSTNSLSSYPESSLAWIGAFQIAANLFCAVFSGKLFDAGYVKHLLCAGLLVYTAGLFGLSYASQYWQVFLAQGLACGVRRRAVFSSSGYTGS